MKPVVVHRDAAEEFEVAIDYYEAQRPGLGLTLKSRVAEAIARVQRNPQRGSRYKATDFRFLLVKSFPYVIYYIELEQQIWIAAIAHGSRRPDYWRRRQAE